MVALPVMPVAQGIEAARWLLQQPIKFHEKNCSAGLDSLRAYSYAFDEDRRVFSDRPEHSWSSHGADAFRYLATSARYALRVMKKTPEEKKAEAPAGFYPLTLDELHEDHEKGLDKRRRIP